MKSTLLLRPVFHRLEPRIRAHVLICWLALLLVRVAENSTASTWDRISREMDRLAAVTLTGAAGTVVQATEPTDRHAPFSGPATCRATPDHRPNTTLTCDDAAAGALPGRGHTPLPT